MKATVFFSSTAAILVSSILLLSGCVGGSNLTNTPPPASPTGGSAHATFAYVRNDNSHTGFDGTISGFRMNRDGTLAALPGSPFAITGNLAVSGHFLLVADSTGITSYRIDPASGSLTPAAHTVTDSGIGTLYADPIAVDSNKVYRGGGNLLFGFSIDDNGSFAPIPGAPFPLSGPGGFLDNLAVGRSVLLADFGSPKFDSLLAYNIQNNGAVGGGQEIGGIAWSLAVHPSGKIAYSATGAIKGFTIDANGTVNQGSLTLPSSGNLFQAVAIDPTGKFLAAIDTTAQSITDSHISVFSIDPVTGNLTQLVAPVSTGVPLGSSITFDSSGRFIVITHGGDETFPNDVMTFSFDPAGGAVTKIQSASTGVSPGAVVIATF